MSLVKTIFQVSAVKVWGRPPQAVQRLAVLGGSGGEFIQAARDRGAQIYVTGEVRHHQVAPESLEDFAVLEVGHYSSEAVFMDPWAEQLRGFFAAAGLVKCKSKWRSRPRRHSHFFKPKTVSRRSNLLPELNKLIEVQELDKVIQEVTRGAGAASGRTQDRRGGPGGPEGPAGRRLPGSGGPAKAAARHGNGNRGDGRRHQKEPPAA